MSTRRLRLRLQLKISATGRGRPLRRWCSICMVGTTPLLDVITSKEGNFGL